MDGAVVGFRFGLPIIGLDFLRVEQAFKSLESARTRQTIRRRPFPLLNEQLGLQIRYWLGLWLGLLRVAGQAVNPAPPVPSGS